MKRLLKQYFPYSSTGFVVSFIFVLLLAFGLRLADITDEPVSFYPVRQLKDAVIARGMYYQMLPSADPATRQQAIAFWKSIAVHEPLILNRLVALTYLALGREVWWVAGIYNTIAWVIGGLVLFALARRMAHAILKDQNPENSPFLANVAALLAFAYYLILPFGVESSRSFQPDPNMVMWIILAIYALYRWMEDGRWVWAILAGIFSGIAILVKVMALWPIGAVILAFLIYKYFPRRLKDIPTAILAMLRQPQLWAMAVLLIAPALIFYMNKQDRASDYASAWMFSMSDLLLSPANYLSWASLMLHLLNPIALLAALVGVIMSKDLNRALLLGLWAGYFVYGLFFPYQIGTHWYYHLHLVPIMALSLLPVFLAVLQKISSASQVWRWIALACTLAVLAYFSAQSLMFWYSSNYRSEPVVWKQIASQLPTDGKMIAVTQDFGFRLMYYGWRWTELWPNVDQLDVRAIRKKTQDFNVFFKQKTAGMKYFLVTDFQEFDDQPDLKQYLYANYPIINQGSGYILFDLSQPKQGS